jgi:hypothetical protein
VNRNVYPPYHYGDVVQLTPAPAPNWSFTSWTGDLDGTSVPGTITMNANKMVTITFSPPTCYTLTLTHSGQGSDPVASPANSAGCSTGQYVAGETISLSGATPATGSSISSWTGTIDDASTASNNSLSMPASSWTVLVIYKSYLYLPIIFR